MSRLYYLMVFAALILISCDKKKDTNEQTENKTSGTKVTETENVESEEHTSKFNLGDKLDKNERALRLLKEVVQNKLKKYQHLTILGRVEIEALKLNKYVLLLNEDGVVIDRALIEPDGSFSFKKLPSGQYSVILENPLNGIRSNVDFNIEDDSELLSLSEDKAISPAENDLDDAKIGDIIKPLVIAQNKLLEIPIEEIKSHQGKLKGVLLSSDNSKRVSEIILLLLDNKGKVLQKMKTNTIGEFVFEKLPSSTTITLLASKKQKSMSIKLVEENDESKLMSNPATVIEKTPSPALGSKVNADYINANRLSLIPKDLFRDDICVVKGNITSSITPLKDCELLLLDSENKVVRKTFVNEKGAFVFDKLPYGDYQVLVDDYKGGIKINVSVEEDASSLTDVKALQKTTSNDPATLLKKNKIGQVTISNARNITGHFYELVGKEKKGIPNAEIILLDENTKSAASTKTDQSGIFHLNNLAKGNYNVVSTKNFGLMNVGLDIKYRDELNYTNEH